ncbi:MAG: long-chain fatty acid--CoA ligase [Acidobacteria bacterium]|nr:long-chain fatty acid--CoA ligase [Acidobacteriota bacterium]
MTAPSSAYDDVRTLAALPFYVAARYDRPAHVRRCEGDRFVELSSRDILEQIRAFSLGLQALGVRAGDRIGIVCESRPEWSLADLAILTARAITVPVYPTLSATQTRFILNDAGASVAIVSDAVQLAKLQEVAATLPGLHLVIVVVAPEPVHESAGGGPAILTMADVVADGRRQLQQDPGLEARYEAQARSVVPSDIATIIYTSGTTGAPKGVVLTHDNIMSNVVATNAVLKMSTDDVALSFLPLSHTFERTATYIYLFAGASVVFAESLQTVARDLARVAPTVMAGAPRVFEKFHHAVLDSVATATPLKRRLFGWAVGVGRSISQARFDGRTPSLLAMIQAPLADALVLRKVRARTGGRIRAMVSGSAPLARTTAEFFYAIGLPIIEGYGLTESAPVITVNPLDRPRLGTVGRAIPGVEIRIADDGEILVRGPNIMRGYYNRPADTAAVLVDGWLHTGDIGRLDADEYLSITDRKKDLIVTSGGKNIAPQPIQMRLKSSPLVSDAIIIGDRRKFPAALIVPDFVAVEASLREHGAPSGTREQLAVRPDVQALFQRVLDQINLELAQFEKIKRFALLPSEMTIEGGELTPTLKLRRSVVEERWAAVIEQLYATREPVASS